MAINRKTIITLVVVAIIAFWAFDSVRTRSFSGRNLTFPVANGIVTVTNPTDEGIAVQLLGTGTRAFTVSSPMAGIAGASVRQGTGPDSPQLFEFVLPSGGGEFTIARGNNVNFTASSDTALQATVSPMSPEMTSISLMLVAIVIGSILIYSFGASTFRWVRGMLTQRPTVPAAQA